MPFGTRGKVRTKLLDVAVPEGCRDKMTRLREGQNILPIDVRIAVELR